MKRALFSVVVMLVVAVSAQAKMRLGVRTGLNVTEMSFSKDLINASNRSGFYIGPTLKFGLPLGFGLEASALYVKMDAETDIYSYDNQKLAISRQSFAVPINVRKGFGFGENLDFFVFAGPQFDFGIKGDVKFDNIKDNVDDWRWKSSVLSINAGAGITLLKHIEVRASYNFPCGSTGAFQWEQLQENAQNACKGKIGGWQVGAAIYF